LVLISHEKSYFRAVAGVIADHADDPRNLPDAVLVRVFRDQSQLAVIVDEAFCDEPLMRDARVQPEWREIAPITATLRGWKIVVNEVCGKRSFSFNKLSSASTLAVFCAAPELKEGRGTRPSILYAELPPSAAVMEALTS
jgi:hypothetical protein